MSINWKRVIIIGVLSVFAIALLEGCGYSSSSSSSSEPSLLEQMENEIRLAEEQKTKHWQISRTIDEMTDKERVVASLRSRNKVEFDFPYDGGSYLTMSIRRWNNDLDVYFTISEGQFVCSEYQGTDIVSIRFDDEEAVKYKVVESSSGRSDILFIKSSSSEKTILSKCKKAHTIKVQANFYDDGSRVFTFEPEEPLAEFE